jgi:hypothetical protein
MLEPVTMSDELWSRALALPAAERAELAHALMDSLYDEVDWDTGPGWHVEPDPALSGTPPTVAEVIDMQRYRSAPRRA